MAVLLAAQSSGLGDKVPCASYAAKLRTALALSPALALPGHSAGLAGNHHNNFNDGPSWPGGGEPGRQERGERAKPPYGASTKESLTDLHGKLSILYVLLRSLQIPGLQYQARLRKQTLPQVLCISPPSGP